MSLLSPSPTSPQPTSRSTKSSESSTTRSPASNSGGTRRMLLQRARARTQKRNDRIDFIGYVKSLISPSAALWDVSSGCVCATSLLHWACSRPVSKWDWKYSLHEGSQVLLSVLLLLFTDQLSLLKKPLLSLFLVLKLIFLLDSSDVLLLFHLLDLNFQLCFLFFVLLNRSWWLNWAQWWERAQCRFSDFCFFFNFFLFLNPLDLLFVKLFLAKPDGLFKLFLFLWFLVHGNWHGDYLF